MSRRFDCADQTERMTGLAEAISTVRRGELVVLPTDTVYGIGADAFTPSAVNALLEAKGRGRDIPVPVLVGTVRAANALVESLGTYGQDLVDAFWPGPLTLILRANRSLSWDLGDTKGTVAVRMPLHPVALDLLKETGPMAVSSANRSGNPPPTTVDEAEEQLGDAVDVYLDAGPCADSVPSTIVDLTTAVPRVLRKGAIPVDKIRALVGYLATEE
ncbi:L-threonylcarbamoyladenylate synthase [Microbispora hainanensis]|uniref:L-threonylcarbamoyladenylate synthase n=1 Tax=Microbispora hainanensis TaxID=568844 RepID=A0ABZ1T0R1_9ACTN|nr:MULTISPECIES: L-threonylcarbamoyladenylate synthase [Microbispora]NJP24819.1 threonylcarbamoyl-AMP synthase [Microbispora sp. CL1-1]TQS14286.1 threonylcarbamoyl-AMP synthase [Microbispora sp. SCL1-1]